MSPVRIVQLFCLTFLMQLSCPVLSQEIFVSPKGDDTNPGSRSRPIASLQKAIELAKTYYSTTGSTSIRIVVGSGRYALSGPLVIENAFSDGNKTITFVGDSINKPVLSGGVPIGNFTQGPDGLWSTKVPQSNKRFEQLYVNGEWAQRARWPNSGGIHPRFVSEKVLVQGSGKIAEKATQEIALNSQDFRSIQQVSDEDKSNVIAKFYHNWDNTIKPLTAINAGDTSFSIAGKGMKPWNKLKKESLLVFENAKAFLDEPGEWFLDNDNLLSYYPRPGDKLNNTECLAPTTEHLLLIKGSESTRVKNIRFKNITFEVAGYNLPKNTFEPSQAASDVGAAIEVDFATNINFEDCNFSKMGGNAIWFRGSCSKSSVRRSQLYDLGAGAIKIGEKNIRKDSAEVTNNILIQDNVVQAGGRVLPCATALVIFNARNNLVSHNEISDFFYTGISVGWAWGYGANPNINNRIEYNHVHNLGQGMLSDMGGIYTLGRAEGTVISNNVVHDIAGSGYGGWGLYCDEGSSGITIENNLVYNCSSAGFHQHYGENNVVSNNIFAFNGRGELQLSKVENHRSLSFEHNIVLAKGADIFLSNWTKADMLSDSNCYWMGGQNQRSSNQSFMLSKNSGKDQNSVVENPLFAAPSTGDFRIKNTDIAKRIGFVPFDYANVGPSIRKSQRTQNAKKKD
jgi:parallel beta-helix repeat protein